MKPSEAIQDEITSYSVDLTRVDASLRKQVIRQLKKLEKSLVAELEAANLDQIKRTPTRMKRLNALLKQTRETLNTSYSEIGKDVRSNLKSIAKTTSEHAANAVNTALRAEVASVGMSSQMLSAIASDTLIQGAPSSEWWSRQKGDLLFKFKNTVRDGLLRGDPTADIVRKLVGTRANRYKDGIFEGTRRQAEALVRTSVQAVANEARVQTYKDNDDIVKGVEWVSTLDGRTSTICKAFDGLQWDNDGKPIGHNKDFIRPPAHFNCRSTLSPALKSWEELGAKGKFKEIPESTRASMDGQVAAGKNYEEWLKGKSEAFQIEVLGKKKRELWLGGKITFTDLVDQRGNELTVEQLIEKYT